MPLEILKSVLSTEKRAPSFRYIRRRIVGIGPVTFGKNLMALTSFVEIALCSQRLWKLLRWLLVSLTGV